MPTQLNGFREFRGTRSSDFYRHWELLGLQAFDALRLAHCGVKMLCDGSAIAGVSEHHGFLHRPRVVAIYESAEAVVAIFAASSMGSVHWFAFDKKSVIFGDNRPWLTFIVTKFEKQVGSLGEPGAVVISDLTLAHDDLVGVLAKARDAARLTEIIFDCAAKGGGNLIFRRSSERETLLTKQFKCSEHNSPDKQNHRQPETGMWQMVAIWRKAQRE